MSYERIKNFLVFGLIGGIGGLGLIFSGRWIWGGLLFLFSSCVLYEEIQLMKSEKEKKDRIKRKTKELIDKIRNEEK